MHTRNLFKLLSMESVLESLKAKFAHIHPLVFHRSVEKAESDAELFDILDTIPAERPIIWDESVRRWKVTSDLLQGEKEE